MLYYWLVCAQSAVCFKSVEFEYPASGLVHIAYFWCYYISDIECMGKDCDVLIPEDFVLATVTNPKLRDKYQEYAFSDFVKVTKKQSSLRNVQLSCPQQLWCCLNVSSTPIELRSDSSRAAVLSGSELLCDHPGSSVEAEAGGMQLLQNHVLVRFSLQKSPNHFN